MLMRETQCKQQSQLLLAERIFPPIVLIYFFVCVCIGVGKLSSKFDCGINIPHTGTYNLVLKIQDLQLFFSLITSVVRHTKRLAIS